MNTATLSSKYQLLIPKKVREQLKLKAGQKFTVLSKGNVIFLVPLPSLDSLRGSLKGAKNIEFRDQRGRY